jgi:signal transduction histidine kinase
MTKILAEMVEWSKKFEGGSWIYSTTILSEAALDELDRKRKIAILKFYCLLFTIGICLLALGSVLEVLSGDVTSNIPYLAADLILFIGLLYIYKNVHLHFETLRWIFLIIILFLTLSVGWLDPVFLSMQGSLAINALAIITAMLARIRQTLLFLMLSIVASLLIAGWHLLTGSLVDTNNLKYALYPLNIILVELTNFLIIIPFVVGTVVFPTYQTNKLLRYQNDLLKTQNKTIAQEKKLAEQATEQALAALEERDEALTLTALTNQRLEQTAQKLAQRNQELLELSQAIDTVAENERASIAHELHDAVVNPFETRLALLQAKQITGLTPNELQTVVQELAEIRANLRQGLLNLHAAELEEHGLYTAIVYMTKRTCKDQAFKLHLQISDNLLDYSINDNIQHSVYRITQQALQNTIKHAAAQNVTVYLAVESKVAEALNLILRVTDDGKGFEIPLNFRKLQVAGHNGLAGFSQKVKLLGGVLHLDSNYGHGTTISIEIPLVSKIT